MSRTSLNVLVQNRLQKQIQQNVLLQNRTPRQVMTLKDISVHFVRENLKNYSTEELHSLPGQLIQDLVDALKGEEYYNIPNVYKDRLISPTLTKLDLIQWKEHGINDTVKLITCKNLTHLNMGYWNVDAAIVKNLVGNLPNIVDLQFQGCDDDILEEIGNSCPELKILILNDAEVTDEGISRLCQSKSKGCKIEHLRIGGGRWHKKFTKKGCLIALENLKSLRYFGPNRPLVDLLRDWRRGSSNFPTLQLTELWFPVDDVLVKEDFFFLRKVCPQLRKLSIYYRYPANDLYLVKTPWDHLEEFNADAEYLANFTQYLPLLTNIGANFTTLDLRKAINIQVIPLGVACPNLINLKLHFVHWSSEIEHYTRKDCEIPFRKLKTLDLLALRHLDFNLDEHMVGEQLQIKLLIQNCINIEELKIACLLMKEETFLSILQLNPLFHLTKFEIMNCETLSKAVVMELLHRKNELEFLSIYNCPNIDPLLKSYIKRYNYNVKCTIKTFNPTLDLIQLND